MNPTALKRLTSLLLYLLPIIGDMVAAQLFFINAVRLAHEGASAPVVANTITTWSVTYLISCLIAGRLVTRGHPATLMAIASLLLSLVSLLFTVLPGIAGIYTLMGVAGIATAFFFVPFQVLMKMVDSEVDRGASYSSAMYTFSWSLGFALGPFVSGFLMDLGTARTAGWILACWFAASAMLVAAAGVVVLKFLARRTASAPPAPDRPVAPARKLEPETKPDLAWLGWVAAGTGVLVLSFIRGIFPMRAENELHLSPTFQGVLFFLLSLVQGLTGLAFYRTRAWVYGWRGVAALGASGILGTTLLGLVHSPIGLALGAILFGLYSGGFFFYLVFHAVVHPTRSARYISFNEVTVGVSSLVGALSGGWLADHFGFHVLYLAGAALILATVAFQIRAARQARRSGAPPAPGS